VCYRLYAEADYQSRPRYTDPEILRASLANVILRMLALGLGRVEEFPFLETPDARAIADGWQVLQELGAIDPERRLTPIGRTMARLPVDAKLARMLIAAREHGALREVLAIAAFLGIQDPRERPPEQRQAADTAHALFADPKSEFIGIVKLWEAYRDAHEELTQSKLRDWCGKHFLGFLRMREWRELHRQLLLLCEELGWSQNAASADYGELHRALIAGLPTQVGYKTDKGVFEGPRGRKYALFPGSALAKQPPPWVLSALLLDTQKVWALTNARIEPDWIIAELPHLLARKHFDPHWSRAQGTRGRIGTDFPVRPGARAEASGALRRPVSTGVARDLRAPGLGAGRDQHPGRLPAAQSCDAGAGA
jgi:ATP-dependent helicase HrpA